MWKITRETQQMGKINKIEIISKDNFLKAYPTLYYGRDGENFVVFTPDEKVCALASVTFPGYQDILKRYHKHMLEEKPIHLLGTITCILVGTPLQTQVWKALLEIPKGKTVTYQELATKIGKPKAYRAVANAVGANPLSLIPCHRVIRKGGALGGYYWGTEVKEKLLKDEGVDLG